MKKQLFFSGVILLGFVVRSPAPSGGGNNGGGGPDSIYVNVDGNEYDVTTVNTTFASGAGYLESEPWYGNASLASAFASAVGTDLTQQSGSSLDSSFGPLFAYGYSGLVQVAYAYQGSSVLGETPSSGSVFSFAILEAVPETTLNPALIAAAGILAGLWSWRGVRFARA